ncbi:MAG TPA: hypothetical protein VEI26_04275 [Terriglobales bacterium]|nr:hypothetical protein [Terriglobales bacterium]
MSIRIRVGNPRTGGNTVWSRVEGDFAHFKIAANAEVRDLAILFYSKVLDQFRPAGTLWVQVQSKWGRKKDLALATREPIAALPGSLVFTIKDKHDIEEFLYKFWHRGPLRFYIWRDSPCDEKARISYVAHGWKSIEEFHDLFPKELWLIADIDPWEKYLHVITLKEDSQAVTNAVEEGKLLLSVPMTHSHLQPDC